MGPQGAPALGAAPATLELGVGLEAQPAALPLRRALVQVNCGERREIREIRERSGEFGVQVGVGDSHRIHLGLGDSPGVQLGLGDSLGLQLGLRDSLRIQLGLGR